MTVAYYVKPNAWKIHQIRGGTKLAKMVDLLARPKGATAKELAKALSRKGQPVPPERIKPWFTGVLNRSTGYGVKNAVTKNKVERFFLVLPQGMKAPLLHMPKGPRKVKT